MINDFLTIIGMIGNVLISIILAISLLFCRF